MKDSSKEGSLLGAILLIVGCCVGAGMLGLPVVSASSGFIPSLCAMIVCYLFATITGLYLVEASLWYDHKVHLITLAETTLGKVGKGVVWSFFLFLFYCLFVAYLSGGGELFAKFLSAFDMQISGGIGALLCALFVSVIIYMGTGFVGKISRFFLFAVAVCFCSLVGAGLGKVNLSSLETTNWTSALATIPILFICFGYQNLVPTIIGYVHKNVRKIRLAIIFGNLIPLVIYALWNFVILGIMPQDQNFSSAGHGEMVTDLLQKSSDHETFFFVNVFSFFSIITPFLASSLAFIHFLKDGLKNTPVHNHNGIVFGLVLIPPVLFTLYNPGLFLSALSFAGGFIDAVLFGIMPALIVWKGRYKLQKKGPYLVMGGRFLLSVVMLFSSFVLIYRLYHMFV